VGRFLRAYKLDELPQLFNVIRGDMNLIGPRPEVAQFVDFSDPTWRQVLQSKPGITDLATLTYRNEEQILAEAADSIQAYRQTILPHKLALNLEYQRNRSWKSDLRLLALTVRHSLAPGQTIHQESVFGGRP
jgi:lipopolysaccharide/colanic/teichoic acid biosynthesis glycosyltransferase